MQIRLHKEAYMDIWDTSGHTPKASSRRSPRSTSHMIPALVEEGIEWVIVDNGHFDRTCQDFPWSSASSSARTKPIIRNPGAATTAAASGCS